MEHCWLLPTTCPPTKLKSRTVCCQEGEEDENMTPSDTTITYKVSLLLLFHSDFCHNSLGFICTCHYLLVRAHISQSASPSKLLCHRHGLVIHNCDPGPSWSTPHIMENMSKKNLWTSSTLATSLGGQQGCPTQVGGPIEVDFESVSESKSSLH